MKIEQLERPRIEDITKDEFHQKFKELFEDLNINEVNSHVGKGYECLNNADFKIFQINADEETFIRAGLNDVLCLTLFDNKPNAPLLISVFRDEKQERLLMMIRNVKSLSSGQVITIISEESSDELIIRNDPKNYPTLGPIYKPKNYSSQLSDCFALVKAVGTIASKNGLFKLQAS